METIKQVLLITEVFCLFFSFLQSIAPNNTESDETRATVFLTIAYISAIAGTIIMTLKWTDSIMDYFILAFSITILVYALIYTCKKKKEHTKLKK